MSSKKGCNFESFQKCGKTKDQSFIPSLGFNKLRIQFLDSQSKISFIDSYKKSFYYVCYYENYSTMKDKGVIYSGGWGLGMEWGMEWGERLKKNTPNKPVIPSQPFLHFPP